jgi:ferredoxin
MTMAAAPARSRPGHVLTVDPISCAGHGVCGDLFPEWIRMDDWGFPSVDGREIPPDRLAQARWAVDNCPALALRLRTRRQDRS